MLGNLKGRARRYFDFAALAFAAFVALATSTHITSLPEGSYQVISDCPEAQSEGTLQWADFCYSTCQIADATNFGFPNNVFANDGTKIFSSNDTRICTAIAIDYNLKFVMFVCKDGGSADIACTITLQED